MKTILTIMLFTLMSAFAQDYDPKFRASEEFLTCSLDLDSEGYRELVFALREVHEYKGQSLRMRLSQFEHGFRTYEKSYGDDKVKMLFNPSRCQLKVYSEENTAEEFELGIDMYKGRAMGGTILFAAKVRGRVIESFGNVFASLGNELIQNREATFYCETKELRLLEILEDSCQNLSDLDEVIELKTVADFESLAKKVQEKRAELTQQERELLREWELQKNQLIFKIDSLKNKVRQN